jgi:hypothetical protein
MKFACCILAAIALATAGTLVTGAIVKIDDKFVPCGSSLETLQRLTELKKIAARAWPEQPAVDRVREYAHQTHSLILEPGVNVEILSIGETVSKVRALLKNPKGNNLCWVDSVVLR